MKNRPAAYRRYKRQITIKRKKHLSSRYWHYKAEGQLDKGKIHCSCPMCRRKSYDQAKLADMRSAVSMLERLKDEGLMNTRAGLSITNRTHFKRSIQMWRRPSGLAY